MIRAGIQDPSDTTLKSITPTMSESLFNSSGQRESEITAQETGGASLIVIVGVCIVIMIMLVKSLKKQSQSVCNVSNNDKIQ